jgi:membrane-bound lytic murein transglycosylase A
MKILLLLLACVLVSSCARLPLTDPAKSYIPADKLPDLRDTHSLEGLQNALQKTLAAYKTSTTIPQEFRFGERVISRTDMRDALEALWPELESFERFHSFVVANFDFYEVYGDEEPGQIFSTGYYDVGMKGSRKPVGKLTEPLYKFPPDVVTIDLNAFAERMPDVKPLQDLLIEMKSLKPAWRGRLVQEGKTQRVVPYYQRAEIQRQRPLKGKGLELAYVDPIDAFFVEIQGSGVVEFPDGQKLRVGYDGQNGAPYQPIGKFLWHVIPKDLMSMQRIRLHLESLDREQQQQIFDKNPSYVFFKELKGESLTFSGAEVTAHRTIASDSYLFPKGTLGFMEIETPVFSDEQALDPSGWEMRPRWVFDQDTGGAIKGGGRTDIYMGLGPEAARLAGPMKRKGKLWYVAPKVEFTERLRARTGIARAP